MKYLLSLIRHGGASSWVKVVSLTLGLLVGILLFAQLAYELSFDRFYPNPDTLVALRMRHVTKGVPGADYNYGTYRPAAADLWSAMPDLIESATLTSDFYQPTLYLDDIKLEPMPVLCADSLYFQTTGLTLLRGDPHDLYLMGNAFISQGKARELFGDEDPVGKVLSVDKLFDVTIRGVYADLPRNTICPHDLLLSMAVMDWGFGVGTWDMNNLYHTLYRLHSPADVERMNGMVQKAVEQFTDPHMGDDVVEDYSVVPLHGVYRSYPDTTRRLVILAVLGFSVFFVSTMNYVLGAISSISRRAKAVGVHKCSGAGEGRILGMFLGETALFIALSVVLCAVLLALFAEPIGDLLGSRVADLFAWPTLYVPLAVVALVFVVAGFVPGRIYARIPVTQVFRRYADGKRTWKRGLLFAQFAGVAFIAGMLLTVAWQYHSLMRRDVGFRSEGMAVGSFTGPIDRGGNALDAVRRQPYVEAAAASHGSLLQHYSTSPLNDPQGNFICPLHFMVISRAFPEVAGLRLQAGKWPQHKGEAVVGRKTVETMKWPDDGIGLQLPMVEPAWAGLDEPAIIVGVVDDVRNMGFFDEQTCTAFILSDRLRAINVRLKDPVDENLARLNAFMAEAYPNLGMEFTLYRTIREEHNADVSRFRNIVWATTICIVLIVLMGLIGYVSDETARRSKEIAIRKVNGARAADVLRLLAADVLRVAVVSVVPGLLVAWYASAQWMHQFADSPMPSPLWFAGVCLLLMLLIVCVVVVRTWSIANENPVIRLKSE